MKRKRFAVIAVLSLVMMLMTSVSYAETIPEREADVSSVSEGYMLAGFDGTYYHTSKDKVLERINAIRKEAYDEGLVSKYVPIKWSSDLEYIAQIRAAEAAVLRGHTRPNGETCFTVTHNGQQSWAEDLAWNYSGMMEGIEQWYNEKADYLEDPDSSKAGHYRSLITVNYKYIGLGCFRLDAGGYTCTSAELSFKDNLDETESSLSGHYRQMMQVQTSDLQDLTIAGDAKMQDGDTSAYTCKASFQYSNKIQKSDVTTKVDWSSSNSSVATIDSDGNVTAKSLGTTTIKAVLKDGAGNTVKTATQELKVTRPQVLSISFANKTVNKTCVDETYFTQEPTIETQDDPEYTVSWKSSNEDVAIVASDGEVTVKNIGETTITATVSKNLSASYKLIVAHGDMETVPAKAATFDKDGYSEHEKCSLCDKEFGKTTIRKINRDSIQVNKTSCDYDGKAQTPGVTVKDADGKALSEGTDYSLSYQNNVKPGTATVKITFTGKYAGTAEKTFEIKCMHKNVEKTAAVDATCTEAGNTAYWSCKDCGKYFSKEDCSEGSEIQKNDWVVKALGHDLVKVSVEAATFDEDGCSAYEKCNRCDKEFGKTVIRKVNRDSIQVNKTSCDYDGKAQTPGVTVKDADGKALSEGTDYSLSYQNNVKPGTATVKITFTGKYAGTAEKTFEIKCTHKNVKAVSRVEPTCTQLGNKAYWSCPDCGKYFDSANCTNEIQEGSWKLDALGHDRVTVPAKAATFDKDGYSEYEKCSLCDKEFGRTVIPKLTAKLSTTTYTYTGGVKTPSVICKGMTGLTKDKDYTVTLPAGRKAVGKYTITVKGVGSKYTGSKTLTYVINPKGTGIKKPAAAKKAFTAKWSKQSAKMNRLRITGYQVQYSLKNSLKSNFKSAKTVTVKGYAKTSKKIGKLKAKKTYYVRVRTYMKSGGSTFYSTWSGRKSVKTK